MLNYRWGELGSATIVSAPKQAKNDYNLSYLLTGAGTGNK
jgi:hypothetical protein